ncbi:hypothetical protein MAHJHV59_47870 [Mycobacterium avium subsp. hominissuis]
MPGTTRTAGVIGPAPWGPGEPPRPAWDRPLPPPGGHWDYGPINYLGYQETPVWDPGFNQWGFWFFGVWIRCEP